MAYIITSKTRKRWPNNKMLEVRHKEVDESRICDPWQAEKLLANQHGWDDPVTAPGKEPMED